MHILIRHFCVMLQHMFVLSVVLGYAVSVYAFEVAGIFGDHMVLQAESPIPVWGTGIPGETLTLSIGDQTVRAVVNDTGRWHAELAPIPPGRAYTLDIATPDQVVSLTDVLVGDVWLCSGQSNMQWTLEKSMNSSEEIAGSDYPQVRLFLVEQASLDDPPHDVRGAWVRCGPETAGSFSAIGYFFGRELHTQLKTPIGLIANAWGGSSAEAWMPRRALLDDPQFAYLVEGLPARQAALEAYRKELQAWEASGSKDPAPRWPREVRQFKWATMLYDRMLEPLAPYALRGVIWYQGEENTSRAYQYRRLFPALIGEWRRLWDRDDLPFLFVQLTSFHKRESEPGDSQWAELREAQFMTLSVPHTAMAVTIDVGDADNIHPTNKQVVGYRLALAALAKVYGRDVEYSGPTLRSVTKVDDGIRLTMDHAGEGMSTLDGLPPRGFEVAASDGPYHWAQARIEGDTITVWSDQVPDPATVRYGWSDNPDATLINTAGIPASPFRTDDRPGITRDSH
ncbi:MAG: sialate O-acetylesterase [Phycisphaerales bacterium]